LDVARSGSTTAGQAHDGCVPSVKSPTKHVTLVVSLPAVGSATKNIFFSISSIFAPTTCQPQCNVGAACASKAQRVALSTCQPPANDDATLAQTTKQTFQPKRARLVCLFGC
jgi:hypothetical protein